MKKSILLTSITIILLIKTLAYGDINIVNHTLIIDGKENQIISRFLIEVSQEKSLIFSSSAEIKEILVANQKVPFSKNPSGNIYIANIPTYQNKIPVEVRVDYEIVKEINKNAMVVLSEVMRTLPNLEVQKQQYIDSTVVITNMPNDIKVFDGNTVITNVKEATRKYSTPLCLGYFNLFSYSQNNIQFKVIIPEGKEEIGLNLISWLRTALQFINYLGTEAKYKTINIIYYENAEISESILNNIIISRLYKPEGNEYFKNIDSLQNFIILTHELLHLMLPEEIGNDIIDIIEGFIQFLAIESLEYTFGNSYPKELVYNSYFITLNNYKESENELALVRYRKYPLVFRYISSIVGKAQLESLFKFISKQNTITTQIFEKAFSDLTGLSFRNFRELFDGIPTLWELSLIVSENEAKILSTAPIEIVVPLEIFLDDANYTISVEIPKSGSTNIMLPNNVKSLILNKGRIFPEQTIANNFLNLQIPPHLTRYLTILEDIINSEQISISKYSKSLSKKVQKNIKSIQLTKKIIFGERYVKIVPEHSYRSEEDIIIYASLTTLLKSTYSVIVISFGQGYYIKDFIILY